MFASKHEVKQLTFEEGAQIIDAMLAKGGRKLNTAQRDTILHMFNNCATPLFLKYEAHIHILTTNTLKACASDLRWSGVPSQKSTKASKPQPTFEK